MESKTRWLLIISTMLMCLLLVVAYYKSTGLSVSSELKSLRLDFDTQCRLNEAECLLTLPDGSHIILSFDPRPVKLVTPFVVDVKTNAVNVKQVAVDFVGVTMDMGPNYHQLNEKDKGRFEATAMLPICTQSHMTWQADVYLLTGQHLYIAPFRFDTGNTL